MHQNPKMQGIKRSWTQEKTICKDNGSSEGNFTCCGINDTSENVTGQRVHPATEAGPGRYMETADDGRNPSFHI